MNFPKDWNLLTKINYMQRRIILCSIAYYELDRSPVSDRQYDAWCKELIELMNTCHNKEDSEYWYVYYDFDGTTGFDLYHRLNEHDKNYLLNIAIRATRRELVGR